ncbi:hypothetical protein LTR06_006489 [Exophiala xenobiotica]|nr:hypothetical protein LTR06_006489 [Exophiala xenobiotica]
MPRKSLRRSAGSSEFIVDAEEATILPPQGRRRTTRSTTAKRTAALAPLPPPPSPREIHISLDHGTVYTKAAVRLVWGHGDTRDITLQELEPITWPNNDTSILTQVAVERSSPPSKLPSRLLWGDEVTEAIREGKISEEDVERHFKPPLFDSDVYPATKIRQLLEEFSTYKGRPRFHQVLIERAEDPDAKEIAHIYLYSDYTALAYTHILKVIAESHATLQWDPQEIETQPDWSPPGNPIIRVGLPLPVASTPDQINLIMASARAAGIPNPYPEAEPASALAYHLIMSPVQETTGKPFLIVDIGGGSVDLKVWTVVSVYPLRVREADGGATEWCGGSFVNKTAGEIVKNKILSDPLIAEVVSDSEEKDMLLMVNQFQREVERQFESIKRKFDGSQKAVFDLRGLPNVPEYGMIEDRFTLDPDDVKRAFDSSIAMITSMIDSVIARIASRARRGGTTGQVDEILLVGGGSQNPYLRSRLRQRYDTNFHGSMQYRIPVSHPSSAATGSTTVSRGALLLAADKDVVTERVVRRGYCVGRHEEVGKRRYPQQSHHMSEQDGQKRVYVSKFLIRPDQIIPANRPFRESVRGWRGLLMDSADEKGRWEITERLYFSDSVANDGLWLEKPGLDVHEMPEPLLFYITQKDSKDFIATVTKTPDGTEQWFEIDYEVGVTFDGHTMMFDIIVPRNGKFPEDGGYGPNPIRRQGHYDCAGAFQLFNST